MGITLRDYQVAAHDAILGAWGLKPWHNGESETYRSVLANLATSAGKTIIAAKCIETLRNQGARCMFVADSDELCRQLLEKLQAATGIIATLEKAEHKASLMADVVIASAQTLDRPNRIGRFNPDHFDYIFVDEAHRGSPRNKKITDYFAKAKICGITATAFRSKLKDLSDFYESVAFELGTFDLIDSGYISPIKVLTLPITVNISDVKQSMTAEGQDYNAEGLDSAITPYYEAIADAILEHAPKRQILAFLPLIKSSLVFTAVCRGKGISCRHIDGNSPDREEILQAFDHREFRLLSNSFLLTTGWDCCPVDCLLNLRPTRSAGLYRQMVGRIIRVLPGVIDGVADASERRERIARSDKPDALILDLLWQTQKLGITGPASLIAANENEAEEITKRLRRLRTPEELAEVSKQVQLDKEEQLRKQLESASKRASQLMDARLLGAMLHAKEIIEFEPAMRWERKKITNPQMELINRYRINPDTITCSGHAGKIIDEFKSRQRRGLAPVEALLPLKDAGVENPNQCSLDDAIRILKEDFPMTFGKKYHGYKLKEVPKTFWTWLSGRLEEEPGFGFLRRDHPAVGRYIDHLEKKRTGQLALTI